MKSLDYHELSEERMPAYCAGADQPTNGAHMQTNGTKQSSTPLTDAFMEQFTMSRYLNKDALRVDKMEKLEQFARDLESGALAIQQNMTRGAMKDSADLCERLVAEQGKTADLLQALERTEALAYELMERCAGLDKRLHDATRQVQECELGELARMRGQLSANRAIVSRARGQA
jgi:hypothetical protein